MAETWLYSGSVIAVGDKLINGNAITYLEPTEAGGTRIHMRNTDDILTVPTPSREILAALVGSSVTTAEAVAAAAVETEQAEKNAEAERVAAAETAMTEQEARNAARVTEPPPPFEAVPVSVPLETPYVAPAGQ